MKKKFMLLYLSGTILLADTLPLFSTEDPSPKSVFDPLLKIGSGKKLIIGRSNFDDKNSIFLMPTSKGDVTLDLDEQRKKYQKETDIRGENCFKLNKKAKKLLKEEGPYSIVLFERVPPLFLGAKAWKEHFEKESVYPVPRTPPNLSDILRYCIVKSYKDHNQYYKALEEKTKIPFKDSDKITSYDEEIQASYNGKINFEEIFKFYRSLLDKNGILIFLTTSNAINRYGALCKQGDDFFGAYPDISDKDYQNFIKEIFKKPGFSHVYILTSPLYREDSFLVVCSNKAIESLNDPNLLTSYVDNDLGELIDTAVTELNKLIGTPDSKSNFSNRTQNSFPFISIFFVVAVLLYSCYFLHYKKTKRLKRAQKAQESYVS